MFSKTVNSAKALQCRAVVSKGPFIATQLNSTRQREQLSPISSERREPVRVSIATQRNSTQFNSTSS